MKKGNKQIRMKYKSKDKREQTKERKIQDQ